MLRVYMGSVLASTEFGEFEIGVTADRTPFAKNKWLRVKKDGISFQDSGFDMATRRWRVPITIDEVIFNFAGLKIGALFGTELRMRRLLLAVGAFEPDLIVGYLENETYNPYALIASGWGCAQTARVPTAVVSATLENVSYSFFCRMEGSADGVCSLAERYTLISIPAGEDVGIQNREIEKEKRWEE